MSKEKSPKALAALKALAKTRPKALEDAAAYGPLYLRCRQASKKLKPSIS